MNFLLSKTLIFLFFYIIILPKLSLGNPLFLKINLEFYPELNLLKGSLFTKLNFNENYNFITSKFLIKEIKTSSNILFFDQKGFLKVSTIKNRSPLYISFEKSINFLIFPITIINPPFPYPDKPFIYEITIKIPRTFKNMEILIPSDELEIKKTKNFLFYTFKNLKPVLNPCIIISTFKLKKMSFSYKNLNLYFYYLPQITPLCSKDLKNFFKSFKTLAYLLENVGGSLYPFEKLYIIIVPENFSNIQSFSDVLLINSSILKDVKYFLHLLAKKKLKQGLFLENEEIIDGLITYLIDYQIAEDKKFFRKMHLAFPKKESKAFFYFLTLSKTLGKKNFLDTFKNFYEDNIFSLKTWNDFLYLIKQSYPNLKNSIISYSNFQKLNLIGKVKSVKKEKDSYIINLNLTVNSTLNDSIKQFFLPIKIETEKGSKSLILKLEKTNQDFQISVKEKPKIIYLDPEYLLWRNLNPNEIPNCIARFFHSPGILIVNKDTFPVYRKLINYFRNLNYKITTSWIEPLNISITSKNLIYLNILPIPWQFNPPPKGFYFKVIPNSYNPKYGIGYFYVSSEKKLNSDLNKLKSLTNYSEVIIKSGKVILKRKDKALDGIPIFLIPLPYEVYLKSKLSPREMALKFINTQIILIGIENNISFSKEFYKDFFQNFYNFNNHIILALDLSSSFQKFLEEYFANKISESQLIKKLKNMNHSFDILTIIDLINWAKTNNIKTFVIGCDYNLFMKVLTKGLSALSKDELSKLPEIDFFNPSYKNYLYSLYKSSTNLQKFNFENFYQAQILKRENLAENIKKLLETFKNYQIIIITEKDLTIPKWGISQYLQKRNITNFETIIFNFEN